jgi:hypothetical protein
MQSRRTLWWNKLFSSYLNSFVHFSPVTEPVECKVWGVECKVWSVERRAWSECQVWGVCVESKVWSLKCKV